MGAFQLVEKVVEKVVYVDKPVEKVSHTGSPFRATARAATRKPSDTHSGRRPGLSVGAANNRAGTAGQKDLFDALFNATCCLCQKPSKPARFYSIASALRTD